LGLPVTTDPDAIAAFLRRRGRRVVFATYQSSPQIAAAYGGRTRRFDLAVADEGRADRLSGRYIHAEHDDIEDLIARADEIIENDANAIRLRR
jgi:predicted helicase